MNFFLKKKQDVIIVFPFQNVEVVMSSIPGGGEGLFARKDLEADLVVCFYNGIRIQVHIVFVL